MAWGIESAMRVGVPDPDPEQERCCGNCAEWDEAINSAGVCYKQFLILKKANETPSRFDLMHCIEPSDGGGYCPWFRRYEGQ